MLEDRIVGKERRCFFELARIEQGIEALNQGMGVGHSRFSYGVWPGDDSER